MAAAYAGLISLSQILHQILNPPPNHHFNFPRERVESLRVTVSSLIEFLETYPSRRSREIEDLEERIVGAVYKAEDILESNVVRSIQVKYAMSQKKTSLANFSRSLQMEMVELLPIEKVLKSRALLKVIENFTSIRKEADEIKFRKGGVEDVIPQHSTRWSSSASLPGGKNIMVGFDEHLDQIMTILASDDFNLLIAPIVGMGGIGKTTLAFNAYIDPYIVEKFDIRAWVSVSQEYKVREIVISLLQQTNCSMIDRSELTADELGLLLHKELFGRRYLIVLDDMWDIQSWDKLKRFLPDTGDASRILVTTRLVNLATDLGSCSPHQMSLLDEENSWNLVYEYVKEDCPIELEEIGRSIARGCGGLPLALVVIGGLLAKSEKTRDYWEYVEQNVCSTANYADDKKCIEILRLSYSQLPLHLKPCFLYLAMFPKTFEIRVSRLLRLWVAEGFIKPTSNKSLEEVANGYLKDLFDRNLSMISRRGHSGQVKNCKIHDLIRDLCMDEAQKNKFLRIANLDVPNSSSKLENERRLSIHTSAAKENKVNEALRLGKHIRSLLSYSAWESRRRVARKRNLLRVLDVMDSYSMDEIMWLTNSRYITCAIPREFHVSSFISLFWSLQTLVFPWPIYLPPEFWLMPQLRHLKVPGITLSDPLDVQGSDENIVVLKNLQTLTTVREFIFSENVLKRIPNLKKLGIDCDATEGIGSFCLSNLALYLHELESLVLKCKGTWGNMAFPISLKKLTLSNCQIPWEDLAVVGSLPNLEVLKLRQRATQGPTWSPNEGDFPQLKFLLIDWCQLETWEAYGSHFPCLEHIQLVGVRMEVFPLDFAHIATLRVIDLKYCTGTLFLSAKMMSREREDFGFDDIQIRSFPPQATKSKEKNVVGMEDEAERLKMDLFEESQKLDVISICGMPGIGKTTMAWKIFHDPETQYEFPIRIWVTVSQEFSENHVFLSILKEFTGLTEGFLYKDNKYLAKLVSNYLGLVKFLLVMDDVWRPEDLDSLLSALPWNNKKSKVLITSREMEVCQYANNQRNPHTLRFLTIDESWLLLRLEVFGKPEFPSELEFEGIQIAHQCYGLPLALVLVGGFLVRKLLDEKSAMKKALTEASQSFNDRFPYDQNGMFMIIRSLSYGILPRPLRKCFLYVGMFPEDSEIPTWKLLRMWIAEGFIQQEDDISLEEIAEKYLNDLISSNLLSAEKLNADGKATTCAIHDVLREFCIEEAGTDRENIFQEIKESSHSRFQGGEDKYQRLCINHSNFLGFLSTKPYCPSVRSFVCFSKEEFEAEPKRTSAIPAGFKQLQVLDIMPFRISVLPSNMYQLLDLRYIALSFDSAVLPASFSKFRKLQTLVVNTTFSTLDVNASILNMIELRHFKTNASATLPKPDAISEGGENIQTLGMISPESCTEDLFDRSRNLKKLGVRGKLALLLEDNSISFNNLGKLESLEKLKLVNDAYPYPSIPLHSLPPADKFPIKLRSLTLCRTSIDWSYMSILGSLENLEVLKLKDSAFRGMVWEVSDGGFPHLEVLHIKRANLETWVASDHHFPRLKSLELHTCKNLQQVPDGLADVPNFQRLGLNNCSRAAASAQKIYNVKKNKEDQQLDNVPRFSLSIFPPKG